MGCLMGRKASPSPSEGGDVFPQSTSFYLKEPLFHVKRAFLRYEESLSSHQRNAPFICKQWSSLPSPFGEGLVVRLLVESKKGVSFCVFPCSFRNSVSLSGSVPFVYSVLKIPQQRTYWCFSTTEVITFLNCELCTLNQRRALGGTHPLPWRGLGRLSFRRLSFFTTGAFLGWFRVSIVL